MRKGIEKINKDFRSEESGSSESPSRANGGGVGAAAAGAGPPAHHARACSRLLSAGTRQPRPQRGPQRSRAGSVSGWRRRDGACDRAPGRHGAGADTGGGAGKQGRGGGRVAPLGPTPAFACPVALLAPRAAVASPWWPRPGRHPLNGAPPEAAPAPTSSVSSGSGGSGPRIAPPPIPELIEVPRPGGLPFHPPTPPPFAEHRAFGLSTL